jgi:hypothetical protein
VLGGGDGGGGDGGGGAGGGGDGALMGSTCTYGWSMRVTVTPVADVSCDGLSVCAMALVPLASVRLLAVMDTLTTTLACKACADHGHHFKSVAHICCGIPNRVMPT